jgi:membrane-associated phospholipid phosphatase
MMPAAVVQTHPMFERRLLPLYALILFTGTVAAALLLAMGFTITLPAIIILILPAYVALAGMLARRIGKSKLAAVMEGGALLYQQGLIVMLLLYALAVLSGPYVDARLSAWDRSLGFDWIAYFELCRPFGKQLLFAYRSFNWQPVVVVVALVVAAQQERLWLLVTAAFLACLASAIVFPFFPAEAPFEFYGISPADFPERKGTAVWNFLAVLNSIRDGERTISPALFTGMIAFPSYHSAAALQFAWATWPILWLRWPMVALNVALLASTPVIGNHYLVDVIAGLAIGILSITASKYLSERNSKSSRFLVPATP